MKEREQILDLRSLEEAPEVENRYAEGLEFTSNPGEPVVPGAQDCLVPVAPALCILFGDRFGNHCRCRARPLTGAQLRLDSAFSPLGLKRAAFSSARSHASGKFDEAVGDFLI